MNEIEVRVVSDKAGKKIGHYYFSAVKDCWIATKYDSEGNSTTSREMYQWSAVKFIETF